MSGWTVRLTDQATQDVEDILDWTLAQFGTRQLEIYTDAINDALEDLNDGPTTVGVRWHPELGEAVATLHVARQGRKGRHLLVFRVSAPESVIEVLRILHDSMDLVRHFDS
ncbi:type II toxin-antitoxin system RelE/ParE family toxin [Rhodoferax sp.]|uniref:type II toxin-antitoxin system RelE/ParE family toxin n=1 Tax=Pseudomonadota TaxID=1224 RepID=UPI003BB1D9C7